MKFSKISTKLLLIVSISYLFVSCGDSSKESNVEEEKTLEQVYEEFKGSADSKMILEFNEQIEKMVDPVVKTASLPANPDGLKDVKLDFEKNVLTGSYLSPFFKGDQPTLNWYKEDSYSRVVTALEDGIETYRIQGVTNLKSSWEYASTEIANFVSNSEYYLALVVKGFAMPDAQDDRNYLSGLFSGSVFVIDTKTGKKVGSFDVLAQNSETLMFPEGGIVKAIREDFEEQINKGIMDGLKEFCADVKHGDRNKVPKVEIIL